MILTKELIELGISKRGGYNKRQLVILGVIDESIKKFIIPKGWKNVLIGKYISESDFQEYLRAKNIPKNYKKDVFIIPDKKLSWEEQYKHPNWQKLRLKVFQRDNFKCKKCGNKHELLHAHHLRYDKNKYIWEVPIYDIITLCENCHRDIHNKTFNRKAEYAETI